MEDLSQSKNQGENIHVDIWLNTETYFPGEVLFCNILFSVESVTKVTLEWVSVQVSGIYKVEPSWVKLLPTPKAKLSPSNMGTSVTDPRESLGLDRLLLL
jgi:DNA relaxase NicK